MPSTTQKQAVQIPVIDISASNTNAAKEILDAATNYGFVFVENNSAADMPAAVISNMFDLSKRFFQKPVDDKEGYAVKMNKGWVSMHTESLDPGKHKRGDFKEAFNMGEFDGNTTCQALPEPLSTHVDSVAGFTHSCHALCNKVLRLFAEALDIPSDWFTSRHDRSKGPSGSITRLLHYPSIPNDLEPDEDDIRAGAHSDYGSVTLLFQLPGQPGLEILTPQGDWACVPVDPLGTHETDPSKPLPILVNIGDLLAYWTNGLLKSTVHRVIFPKDARKGGEDRYSMAYFCHPLDDAELVPVPSERVEQFGGGADGVGVGGRRLTAKDHLNERLAATYGTKA